MKASKHTHHVPKGRPPGIPQPTGEERIKRKLNVMLDSLMKRAIAGEPEAVKACLEISGGKPSKEILKKLRAIAE